MTTFAAPPFFPPPLPPLPPLPQKMSLWSLRSKTRQVRAHHFFFIWFQGGQHSIFKLSARTQSIQSVSTWWTEAVTHLCDNIRILPPPFLPLPPFTLPDRQCHHKQREHCFKVSSFATAEFCWRCAFNINSLIAAQLSERCWSAKLPLPLPPPLPSALPFPFALPPFPMWSWVAATGQEIVLRPRATVWSETVQRTTTKGSKIAQRRGTE